MDRPITDVEIWVRFAAAAMNRQEYSVVEAAQHADLMMAEFNKRFEWRTEHASHPEGPSWTGWRPILKKEGK